ncbi:hypothetical protein BPNPMPFG_007362 (plasmid) [Mesorhizobium sp. AR07]|uniref:Uncharacterized protein n=1 Tax=Mesorhizobium huakuii TaxID=28104 RepID=A0A7G6T5F1_9HYPH|nr:MULTISPECIES: hypothetical protein [Mesorhizobium]QND61983.1 hypothetical protein HB778_38245 [Mesorhizobium huakuii]QND69354.1 hypothetical protein HB777_37150 [Mesorhizobium loti]UVK48841.1 hypothetical protein BPNPMPFG_007362 [Mesorhizobium sp. AR07]
MSFILDHFLRIGSRAGRRKAARLALMVHKVIADVKARDRRVGAHALMENVPPRVTLVGVAAFLNGRFDLDVTCPMTASHSRLQISRCDERT